MIRRVLGGMLRVAPPGWAVAIFVVSYCFAKGQSGTSSGNSGAWICPTASARRFSGSVALMLGVYRAIAFHPYFRPGYLHWLKGTPVDREQTIATGTGGTGPRGFVSPSACSYSWGRRCLISRRST